MKAIDLTSVYCISSLLKICDSSVWETDFQWDVTSANESSSQQCIVWMNHSGQFYELDKLRFWTNNSIINLDFAAASVVNIFSPFVSQIRK